MPYSVGDDPYTDKKTGVLHNLLGITTKPELEKAEAEITPIEISALMVEDKPLPEEFDWELLCKVHRELFKDIYEWAGQPRTIELSKDATSFARVEHLQTNALAIFKNLGDEEYLEGIDFDDFVKRLAHYYSELNVLHPFREGNGRTVRTFLAMVAESVGWHIAWDKMNPKVNIEACVAAYNGDESRLRKMLSAIISPIDPFWGRDPYEFIS